MKATELVGDVLNVPDALEKQDLFVLESGQMSHVWQHRPVATRFHRDADRKSVV